MRRVLSRRRFAQLGVISLLGLAGCSEGGEGEDEADGEDEEDGDDEENGGDEADEEEENDEEEDGALGRPADESGP